MIEKALISVGIKKDRIESLKGTDMVKDVLNNPFDIITLLQNMGISLKNYFHFSLPISKDFILEGLSEEGYRRIKSIGVHIGNISRAEKLAESGKKSLASLYSYLKLEDLESLQRYELNQKIIKCN